MNHMHYVYVVVDDCAHTTNDSYERRRNTASLWQNFRKSVDFPRVLFPRVRDKEVHAKHQIIQGVDLCKASVQRNHFILKVQFWGPGGTLNVRKEAEFLLSCLIELVLSYNFVVLDEIIIVSVLSRVQNKLRMKLVVSCNRPVSYVWFVAKFDGLFQDIGCEVKVIEKLIYVINGSAIFFIITKNCLKGERNPLLSIRVRIHYTELILDSFDVRAKPFLNFIFRNLSVAS